MALGIIGVNLVYGALFQHADPASIIASLLDGVTSERGEIDMIEFSGPAFAGVDNRLMSLEFVRHGLTHAAMFAADGRVVQPSDALYRKCVLIERGSFRPATKVAVDMLRCAQAQFIQEPSVAPHLRHLWAYLVENRLIESLRNVDERCLHIYSRECWRRYEVATRAGNR